MSSANQFPRSGENPEESAALFRELAEFGMSHETLLDELHTTFNNLNGNDEHNDSTAELMKGSVDITQQRRFGWEDHNSSIIPDDRPYVEFKWLPKPGTEANAMYSHVWVRHPRIIIEAGDPDGQSREVIPNDVFLEVVPHEAQESYRYLINESGIFPYADGEMIEYRDDELYLIDRETNIRPNLFLVNEWHWSIPSYNARELHTLIFEECQIRPIEDD